MSGRIPVSNAKDEPADMERINEMIARMRFAIAPMLNEAIEELPHMQALTITAASLFAGSVMGHMIGVGAARDQDRARAVKVATVNFRNGIELGKREARDATLEQTPFAGSA